MGRFSGSKGVDYSVAQLANMRADWDGILRLSSKNEMANPGLDRYTPDGSLDGHIRLLPTPAPIARGIYVGGSRGRPTRQVIVGRSVSLYPQNVPIISGAPLPSVGNPDGYPQPSAPGSAAPALTIAGYPAGVYGIAEIGGIGNPLRADRRRLTSPGPFKFFTLEQGQYFEIPLRQDLEDGQTITGIVMTAPNGNETTATIQDLIDVSRFVPKRWPMTGPRKTGLRAPATNQTFVGASGAWGFCSVRKVSDYRWRTIEWMDCHVAWQFRTRAGWGASQPGPQVKHYYRERGAGYVIRPGNVPWEATKWRPLIQAPDGTWLFIDYGLAGGVEGGLPLNFGAYFHTDDPEEWPNDTNPVRGERSNTDRTGIRPPSGELEDPIIMGNARIVPDRYQSLVTDVYPDGDESAPSPPKYQQVNTGQYLELYLAESSYSGNILPNAMLTERDHAGNPSLWTIPAAAGVSVTAPERGVLRIADTSNGTAAASVAYAERPCSPGERMAARASIRFDSRSGGTIQARAQFLDAGNAQVGAVTIAQSSGTDVEGEAAWGIAADGVAVAPAGTVKVRYQIYITGSSTNVRNFVARIEHMGIFYGLVPPSPYGVPPGPTGLNDDRMPVEAVVAAGTSLPAAGYCVAVRNPSWAQGMGHGIEYYAPFGTQVRQGRGPVGAMTPLEISESYRFSAHLDVKGLAGQGVELLNISIKYANGRVFRNLGPVLATSVDASGRFSLPVFDSPGVASYLEITYNGIGQGRVRFYGWQLERGTAVTAWTYDHAPAGTVRLDFDTQLEGAPPESPIGMLGTLSRWVAGGATADVPDGTSVTARFRSKHDPERPWDPVLDPYYTDLRQLPPRRIVQVEVQAATTNVEESPEIAEVFVEGLRPEPTLTRADGREYHGGVTVKKWSAPQWAPNAERTRGQAGAAGFREKWPALFEILDVDLECWYDDAATAVTYDITHGERLFRLETPEATYVVRILNLRWKTDRSAYAVIDGRRIYRQSANVDAMDVVAVQSNVPQELPINDGIIV